MIPAFLIISMPSALEWLIVIICIAVIYFWIRILVEISNSRFSTTNVKVLWLLMVFFFGIIGAVIYILAGRPTRLLQ